MTIFILKFKKRRANLQFFEMYVLIGCCSQKRAVLLAVMIVTVKPVSRKVLFVDDVSAVDAERERFCARNYEAR